MNKDQTRLERLFLRIERRFPRFGRAIWYIRQPWAILIRIPLGLLLIVGGVFSFLPILGVWMLPLGILLLAVDLPFLRRPLNAVVIQSERRYRQWRRTRRKAT
ncbi:hypothetical protein [Pelagibacterium xiamenense]|uniref:hypothetical protein n=1 Tax=Pelagibacterium xiamenense TaxID=2901140 RepID=UPI001E4EB3F1|nr:hypothetical protein [Pelagibacterium xiamenense]MCD7060355.1 hypothetical protein [Pelagibacterium xiamenense]